MATETGIILQIDKTQIDRSSKGLPQSERIDLILLPKGKNIPCRLQVRKDKYSLLNGFKPKDEVEVNFIMEMKEAFRKEGVKRFDNNILESIKRL